MQVKEKIGEGNYLDLRICDNLELMAEIPDNTIDLIYCDILYGTGRKFKDYQDLKPIRSEIEDHYIPRIKEMHRILKPTGSIYLQMDTRINHWIRCIMDNVFGYDNYKEDIIWSKGNEQNNSKNIYAKRADIIVYYTKSKRYTFNTEYLPFNNKNANRYNKEDENGKYALVLDKKQNKYYKCYLKTEISLNNVWTDIPSDKSRGYDTKKPKALINRIVKVSSNKGDLVADFYAGSFTTAEVCKDLKRNFIGCDINPNCLEKAKERGLFSFTDETDKAD